MSTKEKSDAKPNQFAIEYKNMSNVEKEAVAKVPGWHPEYGQLLEKFANENISAESFRKECADISFPLLPKQLK